MSPENESKFLADLEKRKSDILASIEEKTEALGMFKRKEEFSTEDERRAALETEKELNRLQDELKEIEADVAKFNPNN